MRNENKSLKLELLPTLTILRVLAAGFFANIGLSMILGALVSVFFAVSLIMQGNDAQTIEATIQNISYKSWLFVVLVLAGFFASVLGGYVTGRLAKQQEILYSAMLGMVNVVLSLLFFLVSPSVESSAQSLPFLFSILILFINVGCCVQGGRLAKQNRLARHRI